MTSWRVIQGHVLDVLGMLEDESIQCVVTSPPYFNLRDYGLEPQIWGGEADCKHGWAEQGTLCRKCGAWRGSLGLEPTLELYVQHIVEVFRQVRRVLRKDGSVWLVLGDCFSAKSTHAGDNKLGPIDSSASLKARKGKRIPRGSGRWGGGSQSVDGLKPKDLVGLPWMVAFALRSDGWWLRSDIVWAKRNCLPESVRDRPTRAHEFVFLLAKSAHYYYDAHAIREPVAKSSIARIQQANFDQQTGGKKDYAKTGQNPSRSARKALENFAKRDKQRGHGRRHAGFNEPWDGMTKEEQQSLGANKRSVWFIATHGYPEAHFATFPEKLVEPCVKAGTSAYGCCPKCGAPWARILDHARAPRGEPYSGKSEAVDHQDRTRRLQSAVAGARAKGEDHNNPFPAPTTLDWRPTCACGKDTLNPCIVLDPFCGSGAAGAVAVQLGRSFVGIELNPDYCKMARKRIGQAAPLFAKEVQE